MSEERQKQAVRVTVVGMFVNVALTIFKLIAGIVGKSGAMVADAIHSLSDFLTDIAALFSFKISHKPEDKNHPYGHGKFETLAGLIISVVLLLVGLNILYSSVQRIISFSKGQPIPEPELIALIAAVVAMISKEWLYRYTIKAGKKINSQAVIANAWEHRSDAYSSVGTFFGIGGAIILGEKWTFLDPLAAVVVSFFIIKLGVQLTYENAGELSESAMSEEQVEEINKLALVVPGALNPHSIRTRKIGHYYAVNMDIEVDKNLNISEAHDIARVVKKEIRNKFGEETKVSIHVDPCKQ